MQKIGLNNNINMDKPTDILAYIDNFNEPNRSKLLEMRALILAFLPEADEVISYGMPAYKMKQMICYFAGYKKHIGFYPTSKPIEQLQNKLKPYKFSKGAIQFPWDEPIPRDLVGELIQLRLNQLQEK